MMWRRLRVRGNLIVLASLAAIPLFGGVASAAPIVDFMSGVGGGTISYLGGGSCPTNSLCGSSIVIEQVGGVGTPDHAGSTLAVTQGTLNFTTGALIGYSNGIYTFAGGGADSFTITGSVPGASVGNGTLFSGQLSSVTVNTSSPSGVFLTVVNGTGTMNFALADYFGIDDGGLVLSQGSLHLQPTTTCKPLCKAGKPFGGNAFSIFLPETALTPTPEPGTLVLLGSGLLAISSSGRMVFRRARAKLRGE